MWQRDGAIVIELNEVIRGHLGEVERLQNVGSAICRSIFGPEASYERLAEIPDRVATQTAEAVTAATTSLQAERDEALRQAESAKAATTAAQTEREEARARAEEAERQAGIAQALVTSHGNQLREAEETIESKSIA
jgi:predicted kinase